MVEDYAFDSDSISRPPNGWTTLVHRTHVVKKACALLDHSDPKTERIQHEAIALELSAAAIFERSEPQPDLRRE